MPDSRSKGRIRNGLVWSKRMRCRSNHHYCIEAEVSVDGPAGDGNGPATGLVLSVRPRNGAAPVGERVETPAILAGSTTIRTIYKTPPGTAAVDLQVMHRTDCGRAVVRDVRIVPISEPDTSSHPTAIPQPPCAHPAPKQVRRIALCGSTEGNPTLVRLLKARYGGAAVRVTTAPVDAEAIVFTGTALPPGLRSIPALDELARDRLVVLSPQALSAMSRGAVEVRVIRQKNDPIRATIRESNFITRGFALLDCFPFAGQEIDGAKGRCFAQPQFRNPRPFKEFCRRHGFVVVLCSETNTDATSDRPICLFRPTSGGGILVMDLSTIEATPTTMSEPNLAVCLLLNALGAEQTSVGQYTVPANTHRQFWEQMLDFRDRFPQLAVDDIRPPYRPDMRPAVRLGRDTDPLGPPTADRPQILIRTGLTGNDLDGLYGTMYWLRNLVRPAPYAAPYARDLAARYRVGWIPLCADWPAGNGWWQANGRPAKPHHDPEPGPSGLLIDITNADRNELRIVMPAKSRLRPRVERSLPGLWRAHFAGRYFGWLPAQGEALGDPRHYDWRRDDLMPRMVVSDRAQPVAGPGTERIRIETPNWPADFVADSIRRTDLVATLLELLIGLHCGLSLPRLAGKARTG